MSRDISPSKLTMYNSRSSCEDVGSPNREKDNKNINYNPTVHLRQDQSKRFHMVSPIKAEKIKLDVCEDKSESKNQEVNKETCIKFKKMNTYLDNASKIESILETPEIKQENQIIIKQTKSKYKLFLIKIIDSNYTLALMTLLTIFALFSSDVDEAFCPTSVDFPFDIIQCVIMSIFTIEIITNSIAKENYIGSFFFWLDIIATVSLVQDISFIFDPILGFSSSNTVYHPEYNTSFVITNTTSINNKNGKNAKNAVSQFSSASRAIRVLRIVRIIKLIRILKIYKHVLLARANMNKTIKKKANYKIEEVSFEENSTNYLSRNSDTNTVIKLDTQACDVNAKESENMIPLSDIRSLSISSNI